jgi:DnaJ like chaperone protein
MSYWGKLVGGMAGFAMGGPFGAVMGAALGHAADSGAVPRLARNGFFDPSNFHPARIAAMFAPKEQVFAMSVVALSAKLAKCDGPVNRQEIDAFKRHFRIPEGAAREVGRLFDQARDTADDFEPYARQLGVARSASDDAVRAAWKQLMRDNHPDSLASRGVPPEFIARATDKVARINAAWDRVKRERGL